MTSKRNLRVAGLIHQEVAMILKKSVNDPRLQKILITAVDLSANLSNARIYFTLPDSSSSDEVSIVLKNALGFIRCQLSECTRLRYTPQISFRYDDSISRAEHLMALIDEVEIEHDA